MSTNTPVADDGSFRATVTREPGAHEIKVEAEDWLGGYGTWQGLGDTLRGLSMRAVQGAPMQGAEEVLRTNYDAYSAEFGHFIRDMDQATLSLR